MEPLTLGPLAVWHHRTASPAIGRVLLIHGINEHSGRHLNTVNYLVEAGWEVVRFDQRGCGRSGGRRQWVERFEDYVDDTTRVHNWIATRLSPLPYFVLGHSLGGAIAIHFASIYSSELKGLLLSAPAYKVGSGVPEWKIKVGEKLSRFFPQLPVPAPPTPWISRDPEVVEAYKKDPLCSHFNTLRQGSEVIRALSQVPDRCESIHCPVWMGHGSLDRVILLEGSFEILDWLGSEDRTLHIVPGGFHEPHNDFGKEIFFSALQAWLNDHLTP